MSPESTGKGSILNRILNLGKGRRERSQSAKLEEVRWGELESRWQSEYRGWASTSNSKEENPIDQLSSQLRNLGNSPIEADILAERRIHLEKFCELKLAIPSEGVSQSDLEDLGFRFPPPGVIRFSNNTYRLTKYPEGWSVKPLENNRFKSLSILDDGYNAAVYDDGGRKRIEVLWFDSVTNNRGIIARAGIVSV